jgi:hydroxymethylglutaryl-CoA synthase
MTYSSVGIVGYGAYIPQGRITIEKIAQQHHQNPLHVKSNLLIEEKSVPGTDEDVTTIAVLAARNALLRAHIDPQKIGAVYSGSESHPYAVKPTSTIVGTALGLSNFYMAADLEFACKAGTAALQLCYGLVKSGLIKYGLAIGADTSQASPGDVLEYSASAAGAAFIVGDNPDEIIATIDATLSYSSDTPDFWRRELQPYPEHAYRFTGEPAYFKHVIASTEKILEQTHLIPADIDYVVFHQPNGKFPLLAAKKLGFSKEQLMTGLLVTNIGNSYSASSPVGLTAVLDVAQPGQKILATSYGSGSGSDSFIMTATQHIKDKQQRATMTLDYVNRKRYV